MDLYGKRVSSNARDRRDVADEIEIELVVEGGVDRVHSDASEKRIAVGGRTYNGLGADIATLLAARQRSRPDAEIVGGEVSF